MNLLQSLPRLILLTVHPFLFQLRKERLLARRGTIEIDHLITIHEFFISMRGRDSHLGEGLLQFYEFDLLTDIATQWREEALSVLEMLSREDIPKGQTTPLVARLDSLRQTFNRSALLEEKLARGTCAGLLQEINQVPPRSDPPQWMT